MLFDKHKIRTANGEIPKLSIRFRNAVLFAWGDIKAGVWDTLETRFPSLEKVKDYLDQDRLIVIETQNGNNYEKLKIQSPKGINKDDWEHLIVAKLGEPPHRLKEIMLMNTDLCFWYVENFEGKIPPEKAIERMHEQEIPERDILLNMFKNSLSNKDKNRLEVK